MQKATGFSLFPQFLAVKLLFDLTFPTTVFFFFSEFILFAIIAFSGYRRFRTTTLIMAEPYQHHSLDCLWWTVGFYPNIFTTSFVPLDQTSNFTFFQYCVEPLISDSAFLCSIDVHGNKRRNSSIYYICTQLPGCSTFNQISTWK